LEVSAQLFISNLAFENLFK